MVAVVGLAGCKIVDSVRWLRVGQLWVHRIADQEGLAASSWGVIIGWVPGRPYMAVEAPVW